MDVTVKQTTVNTVKELVKECQAELHAVGTSDIFRTIITAENALSKIAEALCDLQMTETRIQIQLIDYELAKKAEILEELIDRAAGIK